MRYRNFLLTAPFFIITSSAFAESPSPPQLDFHEMHDKMLDRLDTNKDGKVSKDEFLRPKEERFAKFDTNKDGFLDSTEMQAVKDKMEQMREHGFGGRGTGERPPQDND